MRCSRIGQCVTSKGRFTVFSSSCHPDSCVYCKHETLSTKGFRVTSFHYIRQTQPHSGHEENIWITPNNSATSSESKTNKQTKKTFWRNQVRTALVGEAERGGVGTKTPPKHTAPFPQHSPRSQTQTTWAFLGWLRRLTALALSNTQACPSEEFSGQLASG